MTSSINVASEQLCYVPCNFCNIVLAVSVPCDNLREIVTVRCGHCTNLWCLNMASAFQSLSWQDTQVQNYSFNQPFHHQIDSSSSSKCNNKKTLRPPTKTSTEQTLFSRAPQKRQRVPSAYNQFIKEEIQRIKANNPDITHREAFSTAAKNWAHFPHIHFGLMLETSNQTKADHSGSEKQLMAELHC